MGRNTVTVAAAAFVVALASTVARAAEAAPAPEASVIGPRPAVAPNPKSVAVVIGIEKYRRNLPDATGAAGDAKVFAAFAEKSFGIPPSNIHVLVNDDATKSSIDAEIGEWLPRNSSPGGDVFVYFAGHGAPDLESGARYLVPWDADPKFIASQGIPVFKFMASLDKLKASRVFVFFDACFSGAGGRSVLAPGTRPLVLQKLATAAAADRLFSFAAAGPNEITGVASSGRGLFSHYLFRGLMGDADKNHDDQIAWGELVDFTSSTVANAARLQNRDQKPTAQGTDNAARAAIVARLIPKSAPEPIEPTPTTPSPTASPGAAPAPPPLAAGPDQVIARLEPPDGESWVLKERVGGGSRVLCVAPCSAVVGRSAKLVVRKNDDEYAVPSLASAPEGSTATVVVAPPRGSVAGSTTLIVIGGAAIVTGLVFAAKAKLQTDYNGATTYGPGFALAGGGLIWRLLSRGTTVEVHSDAAAVRTRARVYVTPYPIGVFVEF